MMVPAPPSGIQDRMDAPDPSSEASATICPESLIAIASPIVNPGGGSKIRSFRFSIDPLP